MRVLSKLNNIKLTECIFNVGSTGPVSIPVQSYGPVQASAPAQGQPQYVSPGKFNIAAAKSSNFSIIHKKTEKNLSILGDQLFKPDHHSRSSIAIYKIIG